MEKEFVPYELAVKLKALGFDESCFCWYSKEHEKCFILAPEYSNVIVKRDCISVPTFSQAFRFFREKGYDVNVQKESEGLYFGFYWSGVAWVIVGQGAYEEAELACLTKLIEIVESKSE